MLFNKINVVWQQKPVALSNAKKILKDEYGKPGKRRQEGVEGGTHVKAVYVYTAVACGVLEQLDL